MKLSDTTEHVRKVFVTIEEAELEQLAIDAVCQQAGIHYDSSVTARAYHSSRDTCTGICHDMKVEVTVDLSMLPGVTE